MKKKILSFILIMAVLINVTLIHVEAADDYNANSQEILPLTDSMYVDGIEYDLELDFNTGNIIVSGETEASEGTLILEPDGNATIDIENDVIEDESYTLDIDELSEDDVDVEMYDEDGDLLAEFTEYDEIIDDSYECQEAITLGLYVCAAILLYITTYYVLVKSGVTYCIAESFTKAVAKAKAATKKKARSYYYPAVVTKQNKMGMVYISPRGVNLKTAAALVAKDKSMYSYTASMAKKVINKAGYPAVNADGTKNATDFHNNYGYQFKHYHRGRTTSSGTLKKYGKCHSLFGTPVFINKK